MDAITLLKQDHKKVTDLMNTLEETSTRAKVARKKLFSQIKFELDVHTAIEEELLYPLLKKNSETRSLAFEAYEEHALVKHLLAQLETEQVHTEEWTGKFMVLKENVTHHVKEEEKDIFPKLKKQMSTDQLKKLGEKMMEMKEQTEA